MSLQTDQRTGLDELEALDFDPPCSLNGHGDFHQGPAWALIVNKCPRCSDHHEDFICLQGWEIAGQELLRCPSCQYVCGRDEAWRFIALVRP